MGLPGHMCHIHTPALEICRNETWGTESGVRGSMHPRACGTACAPRLALAVTMEAGGWLWHRMAHVQLAMPQLGWDEAASGREV